MGQEVGLCRTSAEGPSGYSSFLPFQLLFLLDYAASSHRPPIMGVGAVKKEGYCGASAERLRLGLSCERV